MKRTMRSLEWDSQYRILRAIDQRIIPAHLNYLELKNVAAVKEAICNMTVRGAPAIGVAAAYGVALAAWNTKGSDIGKFKKMIR